MTLRFSTVLALAIGACTLTPAKETEPPTKTGSLGRGKFLYKCSDTKNDVVCTTRSGAQPTDFPQLVAAGARFRLSYEATDASVGTTTLEPLGAAYFRAAGDELTSLKPGIGTLVVRRSVNGYVADFLQVHVAAVQSLKMVDATGSPPAPGLTLVVGNDLLLSARPFGGATEPLAGSLEYTWSVSDATVLTVVEASPTPLATVKALKQGTATLTVFTGSIKATLDVTVKP